MSQQGTDALVLCTTSHKLVRVMIHVCIGEGEETKLFVTSHQHTESLYLHMTGEPCNKLLALSNYLWSLLSCLCFLNS